MSHFERTEGAEDNFGNNPEFIPLEELAVDHGIRPDEFLMAKESFEESDFKRPLEVVDFDDELSNWEDDVENGKYDTLNENASEKSVPINPVLEKNRQNIVAIEDMKGMEQKEKFWDVPARKIDNSKPKKGDIARDSIRFDDAI